MNASVTIAILEELCSKQVFSHIFKMQRDYKPIAVIKLEWVCQDKVVGSPFLKQSTSCSLQRVSENFRSRVLLRTNSVQLS